MHFQNEIDDIFDMVMLQRNSKAASLQRDSKSRFPIDHLNVENNFDADGKIFRLYSITLQLIHVPIIIHIYGDS